MPEAVYVRIVINFVKPQPSLRVAVFFFYLAACFSFGSVLLVSSNMGGSVFLKGGLRF